MTSRYLAIDLGAESGRVMLGTLEDGRIALEELSRFNNTPIRDGERMYWNIPALLDGIRVGLSKAGALGQMITSVSTDAWGVDYALLDSAGEIIEPVFHYRDPRTAEGEKAALARVDWPTLFDETGIQYMLLNTSIQLCAEAPGRLAKAAQLLTIADAVNCLLCGVARIEVSMASTTQLYNPRLANWSDKLINALVLPRSLFPEVVDSATPLGPLKPDLAAETGLAKLNVVASLSHDTASAVAAVPAEGGRWAYISSGTWSLMGLELPDPIITDACREFNFTNEIGHGGSIRLLKNIVGLWLVQECRRAWAAQGNDYSYADLTEQATAAEPYRSVINPSDPRFLSPDDMPQRIADACHETGQPVPETPGAIVRCALESLALLYARTLRESEQLVGWRADTVHIVGGGSRNGLLNQLTADAANIRVVAGPTEATASGNVLVQAIAAGAVKDLAEARQIVRDSFDTKLFDPNPTDAIEAARTRFDQL
ncbi:MAG: rhamnulokinase family protein [Verrucomicrobiota bacterium]|jgi:rhamnulokinase|nr:rhamnulokinase family protein [Verrucomicrobiota bacterium]MDP7442268.1 rhamnulokinase family protein [Verrucomicrobiota bacterium]|tara:strand:+ start:1221 stop:2675 length:1455 start_codon:yes stop_codon:yes gene_type:complete